MRAFPTSTSFNYGFAELKVHFLLPGQPIATHSRGTRLLWPCCPLAFQNFGIECKDSRVPNGRSSTSSTSLCDKDWPTVSVLLTSKKNISTTSLSLLLEAVRGTSRSQPAGRTGVGRKMGLEGAGPLRGPPVSSGDAFGTTDKSQHRGGTGQKPPKQVFMSCL